MAVGTFRASLPRRSAAAVRIDWKLRVQFGRRKSPRRPSQCPGRSAEPDPGVLGETGQRFMVQKWSPGAAPEVMVQLCLGEAAAERCRILEAGSQVVMGMSSQMTLWKSLENDDEPGVQK